MDFFSAVYKIKYVYKIHTEIFTLKIQLDRLKAFISWLYIHITIIQDALFNIDIYNCFTFYQDFIIKSVQIFGIFQILKSIGKKYTCISTIIWWCMPFDSGSYEIFINLTYLRIDEAESINESSVIRAFRSYETILRHVCCIASNTAVKAAATSWHASIVDISWATKNEKSSLVFPSLAV